MHEAPLRLGVTLGPLGPALEAMDVASGLGVAAAQLDAMDASMRPRELGESGRRDVATALRRRGLVASGVDCFVPTERFLDPARVERAVEVVRGCLTLAEAVGRVPVCLHLPGAAAGEVRASLQREAHRRGVALADFTAGTDAPEVGIDPAAVLSAGGDPVAEVHRIGKRLVAARVVDLLRSGMRGPLAGPGEARLDAMAYRLALEMAGFAGFPVVDARQWDRPLEGAASTAARWAALLPTAEVRP